jgi:hypothetical protein
MSNGTPSQSNLPEDALAEIERELSRRARHPITLLALLEAWQRFTDSVAVGYTLGIYDYANERSARELLAELTDRVPGLSADLTARLTAIDEDFRRHSAPQPNSAPGARGGSDHWWWFRKPLKLTGELAEDWAREEGGLETSRSEVRSRSPHISLRCM